MTAIVDIRILFVRPAGCKSISNCPSIFQEAYNIFKSFNSNASCVSEQELKNAGTSTKYDYYVFNEFEGNHNKRLNIILPMCLLQCIKKKIQIPCGPMLLVSIALNDAIVVFSSIAKDVKQSLKTKVESMAGRISIHLTERTTYLITDCVTSEKYHAAAKQGIAIRRVEFIEILWKESQIRAVHASDSEFLKYKTPVFCNLNISSTGFTEGDFGIRSLITENGGIYSATFQTKTTQILICNTTASAKYRAAIKAKIPCVSEEWITDCIHNGYLVTNYENYTPQATQTSTPTKSFDFIDPNFSTISVIAKQGETITASLVTDLTVNETDFLDRENQSMRPSVKRKSPLHFDNDLINRVDMKRVKFCGQFLIDCQIYLCGFNHTQEQKLHKIIDSAGGTLNQILDGNTTHVLVGDVLSCKRKEAMESKLSCSLVNSKWLVDSMELRKPQPVESYLITQLNETMTDVQQIKENGMKTIVSQNSVEAAMAAFSFTQPKDKTIDNRQQFQEAKKNNTPEEAPSEAKKNNTPEEPSSNSINFGESTLGGIFEDLTFSLFDYTESETETIKRIIKMARGTIIDANSSHVPDYALVPIKNNNLNIKATNIVTHIWVDDCIEKKEVIQNLEYYHLPVRATCYALTNLVLCLSGFSIPEREFLAELIDILGATKQDNLLRNSTTHLIAEGPRGKKYTGAVKWGLPVVDKAWLLKCAEENQRVDEYDFLIGESRDHFIKQREKTVQNSEPMDATIDSATPENEDYDEILKKPSKIDVLATPGGKFSPVSSQITPVREVLARVGIKTDETPGLSNDIKTPDTPYGQCFVSSPSPRLRKTWARLLARYRDRRQSTPATELRKRFYESIKIDDKDENNGDVFTDITNANKDLRTNLNTDTEDMMNELEKESRKKYTNKRLSFGDDNCSSFFTQQP